MFAPDPSRSLVKCGQMQRLVMILNLITGASVWAVAGMRDSELATREIYGPIINATYAEVWAIPLCLGAALHLMGQVVNGDGRLAPYWTPLWRLIGSALCFAVMATFTIGGLYAPIALYTTVHFVQSAIFSVVCGWFCLLAWEDVVSGLKKHREA